MTENKHPLTEDHTVTRYDDGRNTFGLYIDPTRPDVIDVWTTTAGGTTLTPAQARDAAARLHELADHADRNQP